VESGGVMKVTYKDKRIVEGCHLVVYNENKYGECYEVYRCVDEKYLGKVDCCSWRSVSSSYHKDGSFTRNDHDRYYHYRDSIDLAKAVINLKEYHDNVVILNNTYALGHLADIGWDKGYIFEVFEVYESNDTIYLKNHGTLECKFDNCFARPISNEKSIPLYTMDDYLPYWKLSIKSHRESAAKEGINILTKEYMNYLWDKVNL